jgi:adenosylcobinamide amidohydrolase
LSAVVELRGHHDGERDRPLALWCLDEPARSIASAPLGGGVGERSWVLNAQVDLHYGRTDPDRHLAEIAAGAGMRGTGVGMLTAATLEVAHAHDGGVDAWATVGVTSPTWAADQDDAVSAWAPGTINLVIALPVALSDAALVNSVMTATEAKSQALFEAGVPGTGTASDAVCVLAAPHGPPEPFGGPRSVWGARLARAVHAAVAGRLA